MVAPFCFDICPQRLHFPFQIKAPLSLIPSIKLSLTISEPIIYLKGLSTLERELSSPALLRGSLSLSVMKDSITITDVDVKLVGETSEIVYENPTTFATISSNKFAKRVNEKIIFNECFNWNYNDAKGKTPNLTNQTVTKDEYSSYFTKFENCFLNSFKTESPRKQEIANKNDNERSISPLKLQTKDYRIKEKKTKSTLEGHYNHPFQFILDPSLPESIRSNLGSTSYYVEATVTYYNNIAGLKSSTKTKTIRKPISIIRCLSDTSTMGSESVVAMGNWRNNLRYEFCLQNKVVSQGSKAHISIIFEPLIKNKRLFKAHSLSIMLIQSTFCDKIDYSNDFANDKYFQTQKIVLKHEKLKPDDYREDGSLVIDRLVRIPLTDDKLPNMSNANNTSVYPYTFHDPDYGLKITHNIKIGIEVEEMPNCYDVDVTEQTKSSVEVEDAASLQSYMSPLINTSISCDTKSSIAISNSMSNSSLRSPSIFSIPPAATNHRTTPSTSPNRITSAVFVDSNSKYKKVELALNAPIFIMNPNCVMGNSAPPIYSANSPKRVPSMLQLQKLEKQKMWGCPPCYN